MVANARKRLDNTSFLPSLQKTRYILHFSHAKNHTPSQIPIIKDHLMYTGLSCTVPDIDTLNYGIWLGFLYRTFFIELIVFVTDPNSYCSCRGLVTLPTWNFRPIIFYPTFNSNIVVIITLAMGVMGAGRCQWIGLTNQSLCNRSYGLDATDVH